MEWSRLSRSRRDWTVAVDRVDVAGGRIESATEAVDVSTATGRLARGVLAEFAAFESDRIGEVWREVHAKRVTAGLLPNGKPKWGYTYDTDTKIHHPDPVTGPVLQLYDRYLAGESFYSLTRWLNQSGHRTTADGPWRDVVLRGVMDKGFGAGLVWYLGCHHDGAHEPVITRATWQAYLDARAGRRLIMPRSKRSRYLLTGMVKCGNVAASCMVGSSATIAAPSIGACRAGSWRSTRAAYAVRSSTSSRGGRPHSVRAILRGSGAGVADLRLDY